MRVRVAVVSGVVLLTSGHGYAGGPSSAPSITPSRDGGSVVAKIVVRTDAHVRPGGGPVVWKAPTATQWGGGPQQLLVLDREVDAQQRVWLRVKLPIRPNRSTGWIRADHVRLSESPYWIDVALDTRTMTVYRNGVALRSFRAVVGAPATPTPEGLHALYDPIRQRDPRAFLGPWALHLTAFSEVLDDYGGGPGRVAIHGRAGASLHDPLGTARSHGCIRIDNRHVTWLARVVPRGTPVEIHR